MTLEDFFSLTEMNGFTAPSQVRELITVIEKERDLVLKNAADSAWQRSAIASAIAATENQECLDLFIQLGGLHFISNWLKDAQKLSNDSSACFVEESIFDFFRALEKLQLDYEKSVAFEIRTTAETLVDHKSSKVQDKARVLLESWKIKKCGGVDMSLLDVCKTGGLIDDETRENSVEDGHPERVESAPEPNKILDPSIDDAKHSSKQDIICTNTDVHSLKSKTSEDQPFTSSFDMVVMEDVVEQSSQKNSNAGSKDPRDEDLSNTDSNEKSDGGDSNGRVAPKSLSGEKSKGSPADVISNSNSSNEYANGSDSLAPQEIALATSQDAEVAQEAELNLEKSHNSFDLNQKAFSEDFDHHHPLEEASSNNLKQRKGFDLNVTESVEEFSVETNSNRSEHLELDLNLTGEYGGSLPLSSSQNSTKNIDLNNGPSFLNSKKAMSQNVINLDRESAISIMGIRVEVNRRDFASQTHDLAFDLNSGRMCNFMEIDSATPYAHSLLATPYAHSSLATPYAHSSPATPYAHSSKYGYGYGYSNFAPGPAIPFSSPIFGSAGPVSHMEYSKGMPIIPPFVQQPFLMNMASGVLLEGVNKEPAELELFYNSDLQLNLSSGVLGKRKEPYGGFNYNDDYHHAKRYTPSPWKLY